MVKMMNMKVRIRILAAFALMFCILACKKTADIFQRDTDSVKASGLAQDVRHYLLCNGAWSSESEADWISIVPESGNGNGVDYQPYYIHVKYNATMASRTGVFYLIHNGLRCPVRVTQEPVEFVYGTPYVRGSLIKDTPAAMKILVPYSGASSEVSVPFSATLSGAGAPGLRVDEQYIQMQDGEGVAEVAISGTPTSSGTLWLDVCANAKQIGRVKTLVAADANPVGLPCGWNFYALGYTNATRTALQQSPEGQAWIQSPHQIAPTSGTNTDAYLTAVVTSASADWTFNPGIQINGMLQGDYWLAEIPVQNFIDGIRINVEAGLGGAGKSVGFYLLEYSADGVNWTVADGAQDCSRGTDVFQAHWWNTAASIVSPGRVTYDKSTDDTYRKYTIALYGIDSNKLYLRLRALKYCATQGSTTVVKAGWTDLKGLEVSLAQ